MFDASLETVDIVEIKRVISGENVREVGHDYSDRFGRGHVVVVVDRVVVIAGAVECVVVDGVVDDDERRGVEVVGLLFEEPLHDLLEAANRLDYGPDLRRRLVELVEERQAVY